MAAQCRSPRCTAERKGFRRELDSWRHRLIHCVGFESILEGLYGPGLCKDLSLFDDCEPEELVDWFVDEKCSLCNLRKDPNDYTPSGGSAQSTPTGELISQGQFNTENAECQAENYLNALFQKKDLPQNCDPNIPLVAQELMKKMIRQFAIEYVSKSRKMYQDSNGTIVDDPLGCNGIQKKHTDGLFLSEQDGPLDLTVTRIEEQTFQDGVLDLSIKRNGNAFEENSKTRHLKNGVSNGYFLRKMKNSTKQQKENTALFKVIASWCLYHQQQLIGMLKFLKEEQDLCSQNCHSNARSNSGEPIIRRPTTLTSNCQICTNQKSTKSIRINGKTQQMNLPYLTVCLQDLRFTWPNIDLGTVKLNLKKKEDVHLSDQLLHCINTRSKMKKTVYYNCLGSACSTHTKKLPFSSLSKLRIQRTVTDLKRTMVQHGLQCVTTHSECQLKKTSECCQIKADISNGKYMTVVKNVTFKESCCASERQNVLKPNRKGTQIGSHDSSTSRCVNFGSLIKHFLNSETTGFSELLSQKENSLKTNVQTGFHKNIEKNAIFNSSLSDCQTINCAREFNNFTDAFSKEKNHFVMNTQNSINAGITVSVENSHDFLVLKDCKSTETKCEVKQKETGLPHDTLKIHDKNVNSVTKSQLCLPANLRCFVPLRNLNKKWRGNKRHIDQDVNIENTIPFKRNSRNVLGNCKFCDVSHGPCSFQNNNRLFCKCTIRKNSGFLKNFNAEGVKFRNTTENRNTHLKVVVERLEDSKLLASYTKNSKDVGKSKNTNLCKGQVKASSYMFNVPQQPLNIAKQSNCLNSTVLDQTNCAGVEETPKNVSTTSTTSSDYSYYSPIKLMFVSKVESEDGVKYTLSSEYTAVNKCRDVGLFDSAVKTSHTLNPNSFHNRFSENMSPLSPPTSQNSSVKLLRCSDQSHFESRTTRRKKLAHQVPKIIEQPVENRHKKCSQKTFAEAETDIAIFPDKRARRKKYSSSKMGKSRISKAYVVERKESVTQLKIKKVERFLRSSEQKLHIHSSKSLNFQRISKRLKKLRKLSVSETCKTKNSSREGGQTLPSPSTGEIIKYTKKISNKAKKDHNQRTTIKPRLTRGSLLLRKLKCLNHKTRSRNLLSTSFSSPPSTSFSVRSALRHKSKKLQLKCRSYRKRLRSYKQQCNRPVVDKCSSSKDENPSSNIDFQPNTVLKWWSASTPKECLFKDLENKYEQIANTWLCENNGEKENRERSSSTLKFCSSETRSPVQMLFQKKCDIGNLAAWFMQTTETQSLSIGRKANARSPLQKINRKGSRTKAKKPSINSCSSKHFQKCTPSTSEKSTELFSVSKITRDRCRGGQNGNNLKNATDQNTDVCVKFVCPGKGVDVTKACGEQAATSFKPSAKEFVHSTNRDFRSAASVPSSIIHINSLGSSQKQRMLEKNKSGSKTLYVCCSSKKNIQDCKVFLTKLDVKSKMSSAHKAFCSENSVEEGKPKFKPQWKLKSGFTTKYYLQMNKSLTRSTCTLSRVKNRTRKKCNFGMCLRKSKGPSAPYNNHSKSLILERRKQVSKMTLYVETNTKRTKPQIPKIGTIQSEYPKFQLGPIKPIKIPDIRGLSRKGGTYSLTPIRIPHQ